ncbi:hypothetical protein GPECTOR_31g373 [Gonium pectorale]|uniref:FCP1 homology domain-containing protein n=1 Tax=Gonium pectorale TaxID=33097 RepID=A0A150GDU8_GONPE|nr:hypothetical protein GPECTOR_31g373 [Gonium pectorale]|eukprot:KXZ48009.1 hypothetical protein GPECTOR_31g373 [Gonium pectorale]
MPVAGIHLAPHYTGRDELAADVAEHLLTRGSVLLLAPGGFGKSCLAADVGWRLMQRGQGPGGALWVDLREAGSGAEVEARFCTALSLMPDTAADKARTDDQQKAAPVQKPDTVSRIVAALKALSLQERPAAAPASSGPGRAAARPSGPLAALVVVDNAEDALVDGSGSSANVLQTLVARQPSLGGNGGPGLEVRHVSAIAPAAAAQLVRATATDLTEEEAVVVAAACCCVPLVLCLVAEALVAGRMALEGRYTEAEPLYRQALELRQRVLGEAHPDTAASLNNLANCIDSQGRYTDAEPLYRQALDLRQRVLGLKTKEGMLAGDDSAVGDLAIKPSVKFMMMGTPEVAIAATAKEAEMAPEVQDDFDIGADESVASVAVKDRPEVQEKLARRLKSVEVKIISPPRPGKKCLVIDIDYTIFDLGSTAERPEELARPYLHEFLASAYESYDIIIWSATSKKWVEVKMKELGVLGNPSYGVVCLMDHTAMVTVHTDKYGVFDCKPLQFVWEKFPGQYTPANTIMLDDLKRNYIMNPQQGLVIRPFRKAHLTRGTDRELLGLRAYLAAIAPLDSLEALDHNRWERYLEKHARRQQGQQGQGQ